MLRQAVLTWRLDPRARGAAELAAGKVMFVTSRAAPTEAHPGQRVRSDADLLRAGRWRKLQLQPRRDQAVRLGQARHVLPVGELGPEHNIDKKILIPVDFSVPIGSILGVSFSATGNRYARLRLRERAFGARVPTNFAVENSITNSLNGISVGVNGVVITYQARFYVGIGAFGFTAGIYLD